MKTRILVLAVELCLVLIILASMLGCGNKNNTKLSKPPQIPPQSTFIMDFSDFTQGKNSFNPGANPGEILACLNPEAVLAGPADYALGDRSNWTFAALNVGFWNLVGAIGLAIPTATFVESIKQTPVKQPDDSWIWTYAVTLQNVTYTAKLQGKYIASGVRWDMYISKQNEYSDFLWYYGESDSGNKSGYWVLKEKPSNPRDLLRIEWHRDPAKETGDIKYINIVSGGPENGGYISFLVTQDEFYDRSYTIFNKGKDETTYIEWNSDNKAGRVKDSIHFGDDNWHYWDSEFKDSVKPQ